MAVVSTLSNHYKYQLLAGNIDLVNDTIKIILVDDTFVFDKDAHATLADVIDSPSPELDNGNGYTQQNKTLTGGTLTEDDSGDRSYRTFDNVSWTADGGNLGPIGAAILYDDDTADDTVIGCIDFGAEYNVPDGSTFQVQNITISST